MNKLHIPPLDEQAAKAALEHQKILAKPPLALGKLEPVAIQIAAMTGNPAPRLKNKTVVLFASDHHIADHGLSLTSTDVTYIQTRNFLQGGGTINAFTRNAGARLTVVDVGVNYDFGDLPGLVKRKVMHGANDFSKGPAMTREQALECLQVGIDIAREEKARGLDIVAAGEMGIGNTTPSSAIVAVLTGTPVETVTGRGSGVKGEVIRKKIELIERGIALNKPDPADAIDVLAKVGGPEIGAMAGLMLGAASLRVPIVIDGFIAGAAAAIAQGIRPEAARYFLGSHNSAEPGHKLIMDHIGVTMYMDLGLCLGQGTGAALIFPELGADPRVLSEMKTLPEPDLTVPRYYCTSPEDRHLRQPLRLRLPDPPTRGAVATAKRPERNFRMASAGRHCGGRTGRRTHLPFFPSLFPPPLRGHRLRLLGGRHRGIASGRRGGLRGRPPGGSHAGTQAGNHERLPAGNLRRHGPLLQSGLQGGRPGRAGGLRFMASPAHGLHPGRTPGPQPDLHRHALSRRAARRHGGSLQAGHAPRPRPDCRRRHPGCLRPGRLVRPVCPGGRSGRIPGPAPVCPAQAGRRHRGRIRLHRGMHGMDCTAYLLHRPMTPHKCRIPGLNIGCTSFIIPDYYVPAVRECVRYADDIALLLLEAGSKGESLITLAEIRELGRIARDAGITWNIHLPTDGGFATPESGRQYTENIIRPIELTQELEPHTWVMHVVTDHIPGPDMRPHLTEEETERILRSLEQITPYLPAPEYLALENLERHPTDYLDGLVAATEHSRCFDIGHVWKEGLKPEELLPLWLPDIRMCHLHGLEKRDHKSLHHMPASVLDALLHPMWDISFTPLITLEVFSLDDFLNSHQAMLESYQRHVSKH